MKTAERLLDAAKARHNCSDYRLAEIMGVGRSKISLWRASKLPLPDHQAVHLARLAGLDPVQALANLQVEKADPALRSLWEEIARRATPIGLAFAVLTAAGLEPHAVKYSDPRALHIMLSRLQSLTRRLRGLLAPAENDPNLRSAA